jgi:hypothetical protein
MMLIPSSMAPMGNSLAAGFADAIWVGAAAFRLCFFLLMVQLPSSQIKMAGYLTNRNCWLVV